MVQLNHVERTKDTVMLMHSTIVVTPSFGILEILLIASIIVASLDFTQRGD